MDSAVKDMTLVPKIDETRDPALAMIQQFASDPNFDVTKLEALMAMRERELKRLAEQEFNAAFSRMQPCIPTISEKGQTDKGTYAPREDIVEVVRPILAEFGFSLSFKTEWPDGKIRVIGKLKHLAGHCEQSEFLSGADTSGSKNAVQAQGSTVEYGRRYTTHDLLNIVTRKQDDDGRKSGVAAAPEGYADWMDDMEALVTGGCSTEQLQKAWTESKEEFRKYAAKTERTRVETWKKKAKAVTRA